MREYFEQRIRDDLDDEGKVEIAGRVWDSSYAFENIDKPDFNAHIDEAVEEKKADAKERVRDMLDQTECIPRFQLLCELKQQQRVLPFVGAGMSLPSGLKLWSDLLLDLTADSPDLRARVRGHLDAYQYEDAAQDICDTLGEAALNQDIRAHLGRESYSIHGAIQLLPHCFERGCLTTNLDNVLERVYLTAGKTVGDPIFGSHLKEQRGFVNPDEHRLYKLHGTATIANGRVLTRNEYNQTYANDITLSRVLDHIIGARHLLFLGCSLGIDRTVQELTTLFANAPNNYPEHYAFLPLYDDTDREQRRIELGNANITPIWYPKTDDTEHDQCIEDLLVCLAEGGLDD